MKKLSIQWKVSLAVSFYILLVIIISSFITAYNFEKKLFKEENQNTIENIKHIVESYEDSFILRNLDKLNEMSDKISSLLSIKEVEVFDPYGKIIAHTDFDKIGKTDPEKYYKIKDKKQEFFEENGNITNYYLPLTIEDENIGYTVVSYDKGVLKKYATHEILKIILQILTVSSFVIVASFLGTFVISGVMIRPLKVLKEKIVKLTSENLDNPINTKIEIKPKNIPKECIKEITEECWLSSDKPNEILMQLGDKSLKECTSCEKYKSAVGDEIEELTCSFYMMVASLQDYLLKLEEAHRERETLNCMATMGEMSAKVAHEIKNALYSIGNAASYIRKNVNSDLAKEFSNIIKLEVDRLNEMTVTFLNFSKLIEPTFEKSNINEVIKDSVKLIKEDFEEQNIDFILDLSPDVPEFYFDKNLFKQVVFNLSLNALDALIEKDSPKKYFKIKTEHKIVQKKEKVIITFEDNGIGIKEEDKDKIFKPFFTTKQHGTGLGLPMVYKIIFSHGGIIYTETKEGEGTKFIIEFNLN